MHLEVIGQKIFHCLFIIPFQTGGGCPLVTVDSDFVDLRTDTTLL